MAEDTRDIAIATQTEVARMREDIKSLREDIGDLKNDLQQRKGMERVAGWLIGTFGGAAGSGLTIIASKFLGVPLPK